jgi:sulfur carrier protein ThiS
VRRLGTIAVFLVLAACSTKPVGPPLYLVPFAGESTEIRPRAAIVLNSVATNANRHHEKVVEVTGSILPKGQHANAHLTDVRMQEVAHALAEAGVDEDRIVRGGERVSAPRPDRKDGEQIEILLVDKPPSPPPPPAPKARHKAQKSKN